jgi:hypothetical protein
MLYDEPLGESPLFILSLYTSFIINVEIQVNIYNKTTLILHSKGFEPMSDVLKFIVSYSFESLKN